MNDMQSDFVKYPFFDYRYYNKFGNFCPWQLDGIAPIARYINSHLKKRSKTETTTNRTKPDYLSFTFWIKTHVEEKFYDVTKNERYKFDHFDCYLKPINYGNSSYVSQLTLVHPITKTELVNTKRCLVVVDTVNKRPIPLPAHLREKFDKAGVPSIPNNKIHRLQPPSKVFEMKVEVPSSSIDIYQHMNYVEYSRLCFDCASFAVQKGFYKFFKHDIDHYHLRDTLRLHSDEAKMGDLLKVITWQEQTRPEMIYFLIFKNDEKQAIFEFTCIFYKHSMTLPKL
ncbi:DgyrCDS7039 [Dimorphilus gyrociliatus]|uniref:DgyrCDS7039 n=1 Tax=Dimorphilus gyrociliatus TaxID=2664684 RepID=A0A7I8VPT6_9ANNE|nr:DgyrCDS7039 [Dimorphilus gyrociliatus]